MSPSKRCTTRPRPQSMCHCVREHTRSLYSSLKDDDLLSVYKIQSGHTLHMVKGVNRSTASSSSAAPASQLPPMQTGQNVHDPLTQLNSHLGFGAMAGLNPFADMGLNQNDPNMVQFHSSVIHECPHLYHRPKICLIPLNFSNKWLQ